MINKIENKLDRKWDSLMTDLSETEQKHFNKAKYYLYKGWDFINPIVIAVFLFGLFTKIRTTLGHDTVMFVLMVTAVIYLRLINSKLG